MLVTFLSLVWFGCLLFCFVLFGFAFHLIWICHCYWKWFPFTLENHKRNHSESIKEKGQGKWSVNCWGYASWQFIKTDLSRKMIMLLSFDISSVSAQTSTCSLYLLSNIRCRNKRDIHGKLFNSAANKYHSWFTSKKTVFKEKLQQNCFVLLLT